MAVAIIMQNVLARIGLQATVAVAVMLAGTSVARAGGDVCTAEPAPPAHATARAGASKRRPAAAPASQGGGCYARGATTCVKVKPLCAADRALAEIAWKYFANNYQPATGLVNSVDNYPSTTMWDTASVLAATISAHQLGVIDQKTFDDRITAMLATLATLKLYKDELPNKAYNTKTAAMSDYRNAEAPDGIGFSALDLARLASWLHILACLYPKYTVPAYAVLLRWTFCRLLQEGQMYGAYLDRTTKKENLAQEGRLGYEQYAGKTFRLLGFDQSVSARYDNRHAQKVEIYGVPITIDARDPRKLGAYNYVVTESYALDAFEFGRDAENTPLLASIYEVQKRRWEDTGIVTAVSEDNVDRPPYFVYNTIYAAGSPWNTITDSGKDQEQLKSLSTKAAFSLATLFPRDPYSATLIDAVISAYDADRGWYSGVYENGTGYNKAITANTNGIVLEALLYKAAGPLHVACKRCVKRTPFAGRDAMIVNARNRCHPGTGTCSAAKTAAR